MFSQGGQSTSSLAGCRSLTRLFDCRRMRLRCLMLTAELVHNHSQSRDIHSRGSIADYRDANISERSAIGLRRTLD